MALYLTEAEIGDLLTMEDAVAAVEEAFSARARGEIVNRPRLRIPIVQGTYNVMSAGWNVRGIVGHKVYTASGKGAFFQIVLFAADGSGLLAVMSGGRLSALRTGAVTGLVTKHVAVSPEGPVAIIGAGRQATAQVEGIIAATGATEFRVYARTLESRESFAGRLGEITGVDVHSTDSIDAAIDGVNVVVTITNSAEPILLSEHVRKSQTIIAAGNNTWTRSEIHPGVVSLADAIVVDDIDNARLEAGELMRAAEMGAFSWDAVIPLHEIVAGTRVARTTIDDVVLVELQGIALEDIAVAEVALRRALERGVGTVMPE